MPAAPRKMPQEANRIWNFLGMTFEPDASTRNESQINKSFLVLFFKKRNKKKYFFLKKEAKTFVNCSLFAAVS